MLWKNPPCPVVAAAVCARVKPEATSRRWSRRKLFSANNSAIFSSPQHFYFLALLFLAIPRCVCRARIGRVRVGWREMDKMKWKKKLRPLSTTKQHSLLNISLFLFSFGFFCIVAVVAACQRLELREFPAIASLEHRLCLFDTFPLTFMIIKSFS